MQHPDFLDRLRLRLNPLYLYRGQLAYVAADVTAGMVHRAPSGKHIVWNIVDYRQLEKGSSLRFLGHAHDLNLSSYLGTYTSLFEIITPVSQSPISPGDTIAILPGDRKFIYPQPEPVSQP